MEKQAKTGLLFVCDVEGWYSRKPFSAITIELGGCNAMDPTTGTYTANILYTNKTREDLITEIKKKIPGVMPYTWKWFHNAWTKAYGQGNTLAKGLTQSTIKEEFKDQFGLGDTDVIIYWGSTAIDAEGLAKIRQDRAEILVRKEDLTRIPSLNLMRIFILVTTRRVWYSKQPTASRLAYLMSAMLNGMTLVPTLRLRRD